jgi:DNA repair exonuclease SbcCD ATPase subunit
MSELVKFELEELSLVEPSKAAQIKKTFEPMVEMLSEFECFYTDIVKDSEKGIDKDLTGRAKRLRLDIAKVRIEAGKLKDKQKEYIKLEDKAIMGVHNILVFAVKEKEDKLKEIENHFEILEQKRLSELQSKRVEELSKFVDDAHERNLSSMEDDVWAAYFESKKKAHFDLIEAEKKTEAERQANIKAEAEEQERIRKENENLKKEAQEREKIAKIEAEKREEEEKDKQRLYGIEEAKRAEAAENLRKEQEVKLKAEREEKEKIAAELKAKEEAEIKAQADKEAQIEAELNKGDKDKVKDLISDLEAIKTKYIFKSTKNQKMYNDVINLIDKVIGHVK